MTQPQPFLSPVRVPSSPSSAQLALTLLGPSSAMAQLWGQLRRLASHVRTVLLTGEADCGQEAVARLLLDLSPQPHRSFLRLTAAEAETRLLRTSGLNSLPTDIFLFIPDVDRFSMQAQEALLKLLRSRRSRPFTLVAATSEDTRALIDLGRFSAELADALSSVRLALPSLKDRAEDLPMLVSQILTTESLAQGRPAPLPTQDFLRAVMQHSWPGNLAELTQTLASLCATHAPGDRPTSNHGCPDLTAEALYQALATQRPTRKSENAPVRLVTVDTVVQEHIGAVLRACHGNKLKAAEILGISRSTLYRMLDASTAHNAPLSLIS